MSLTRWLSEFSRKLTPVFPRRRGFRRISRDGVSRVIVQRRIRTTPESLEDRVLPATFSWVGDVNNSWSANLGGNTNWSGDVIPASGDSLVFDGAGTGTLENNLAADSSFSMTFNTGDYTITGQSIQLGNAGTDIIQIAGENLVRTPLSLNASAIEVQSGVLDLQSSVTGTEGLTKLGSGTLILTGPASYSGTTTVQAGNLQVDGAVSGSGMFNVSDKAGVGGSGSIGGTVELAGLLSPGALAASANPVGNFSAAALNMERTGVLRLNFSGNSAGQFDTLQITGTASLRGTLEVNFATGYTPANGTIFQVLTAGDVTGYFNNLSGLTYSGGALLPIQTPVGLLLVATPFPIGSVSLQAESHATGMALAEFFAGVTDTVAITGGLNILEQALSGNFTLTRRAASGDSQALMMRRSLCPTAILSPLNSAPPRPQRSSRAQ
jgi:autotransporter-associated beta strand protein